MPTITEKQLTAMQLLREKLQAKATAIRLSNSTPDIDAYKCYNEIIELIDTELLATERQQLVGFGKESQKVYDVEVLFNETFKTQE